MALKTKLTETLGIEHPILLAPMAFVSGGALAAAVTGAGGLGIIGGGYGDKNWIADQFSEAGNQPVGVGFITWSLAERPGLLPLALAQAPRVVMLSFGDAAPFVATVKDSGAKLILQIQTVADAERAAELGADVIVAQGGEAGGHGATRGTLALVPAVVDAVAPVPVAAAGGIADGRGLAAALMLGAAGVLMGTRFYATREALGHDKAKARIVAATGDETVQGALVDTIRGITWPAPYALRTLENAYTKKWAGKEAELGEDERERYAKAAEAGDFDTAAVIAGEGSGLIHDTPPAADIVERTVREAEAALARVR